MIRASTATGYRMPPLHARPALGDCLAVYRHALAEHPPGKILAGPTFRLSIRPATIVLACADNGLGIQRPASARISGRVGFGGRLAVRGFPQGSAR